MPKLSDIMILEVPEQNVLEIETTVPLADLGQTIGKNFQVIDSYLKKSEVIMSDVPYVYYRDYKNIDINAIRLTIGIPVSKPLPTKGNMRSSVIPGGKIITVMYRGSYSDMGSLYEEMEKLIAESGYPFSGICYEHYYNGPPNFEEKDFLTKVVIPI